MFRAKNWRVALIAVVVAGAKFAFAQAANPPTLDWQPTLEDAKRLASQSNRLLLVHFTSPGCQACEIVERDVYSQPSVQQQIHARFVPFKLNVEQSPLTAKRYGIDRIPMDLVLDANGTVLGRMNCPTTADAYLQSLAATANSAQQPTTVAATPLGPMGGPGAMPNAAQTSTYQPAPYQTPVSPPANIAAQPPAGIGGAPVAAEPMRQTAQQKPPIAAYSNDRYAEFFRRSGTSTQSPQQQQLVNAQPAPNPSASAAVVQPPPAASLQPAAGSPPAWGTAGYFGTQPSAPNSSLPYNTAPPVTSPASAPTAAMLPTGTATLGLEGFCPVTLTEQNRWQVGDRRWGAVHRGRTYLFAGPMEQKQFMTNPDRYSPAISGRDVVAALDQGQSVDGQRQFGLRYAGRMYLFSNTSSREAFLKNPTRYSAEVMQAENPNRGTTWR
jgi:YHS domain-containing protein